MTARFAVETPPSESSRIRVEPRVFERLDAIRAAERAADVAPDRRRARWPWLAAAGVAMAAAAVAIVVATGGVTGGRVEQVATTPSLVVTPPGGSSRFTIDDAVIEAAGDTSVEVHVGAGGAVTLALGRGSIDCDVAPRHGRPFRVVAGDVEVVVVGTRFSVARNPEVRVDVAHGKVRVRAHDREWLVASGERWPETTAAAPAPAPSAPVPPDPAPAVRDPTDAEPIAVDPAGPAARIAPSTHARFLSAQRLEPHDWTAAAKAYRRVAAGTDPWAALALYSLAELETTHGNAAKALGVVDEYIRRFPRGASIEDATWLRVEALRSLGRADRARAAAAAYLHEFPSGTYARPAARLAAP